jgi:hypothetical protein
MFDAAEATWPNVNEDSIKCHNVAFNNRKKKMVNRRTE